MDTPSQLQEVSITSTLNSEKLDSPVVIENPSLVCETVNPHDFSFKTVVIHNFRYIYAHNEWYIYKSEYIFPK